MKRIIRVGSRESRLAVAQSRLVMEGIERSHPEIRCELVTMKTTGDRILDRPLDRVGGKGLFVKELDAALRAGEIDLAVHSLKDLPMENDPELPIAAYSKRADPRDALVLPAGSESLPAGLPLGSASPRRRLQLPALFPGREVRSVRGNLLTRLSKLDAGEYGGLVLACAGLLRLGMGNRISRVFSVEEMVPAAGQGILAVQCRAGEDAALLAAVDDPASRCAALAERAFVRALGGGCSAPVAAYAALSGRELKLTGLFYDEAGGRCAAGSLSGPPEEPQALGERLARALGGGR